MVKRSNIKAIENKIVVNLSHSCTSCSAFVNFSITVGLIFDLSIFSPFKLIPSLITFSPGPPSKTIWYGSFGIVIVNSLFWGNLCLNITSPVCTQT